MIRAIINRLRGLLGLDRPSPALRDAWSEPSPPPSDVWGEASSPGTSATAASSVPTMARTVPSPAERSDARQVTRIESSPAAKPGADRMAGAQPSRADRAQASRSAAPSIRKLLRTDPSEQARNYLNKVRAKMNKLAADFNNGTINRAQFKSLYVHYEREIGTIEAMIESAPGVDGWKGAVTEGKSVQIRREHLARAEGYALYENDSGMPVSTVGRFELDPALLVPMLSSYRAATKEIFGVGMRATEIEDGRWLCFVPGEFTTMLAVFTNEPAGKQLEFLEHLHRHFELANRRLLANPPLDPSEMLFPHEYFIGQWRR